MKYDETIFQIMKAQAENVNEPENRYVRRIQLTGRGSYIVSLPKGWAAEAGLRKGGRVALSRQQEHSLLLTPYDQSNAENDKWRCTMSIPPDLNPDMVTRRIISLYVVGYSTIEINSKSGNLTAPVRDSIRDVARNKLVGTEVITESSRSATLQVLLGYPQLLVPDALRRMGSITGSMQQDAMQALTDSDRDLAKQVLKTDDEIDRFSLYIIRQLKWAVQHPPLLQRIGLKVPNECLAYRIVTKSVERSADHAARIAESSLLTERPLEITFTKDADTLGQTSRHMMEDAIRSLFTEDYDLAEKVMLEKDRMTGLESRLIARLLKEKMPANELHAATLISESLRRIGEYATDVAEVVLNLTVQKSLERPEILESERGSK